MSAELVLDVIRIVVSHRGCAAKMQNPADNMAGGRSGWRLARLLVLKWGVARRATIEAPVCKVCKDNFRTPESPGFFSEQLVFVHSQLALLQSVC